MPKREKFNKASTRDLIKLKMESLSPRLQEFFFVGLILIGLITLNLLIFKLRPISSIIGFIIEQPERGVFPEIRDLCEIDKTCCQDIGLNFVCFRNKKYIYQNVPYPINQEYLVLNYSPKDSVGSGRGANELSYMGSKWLMRSLGSIPGGIGRVFMKEDIGQVLIPLQFGQTSAYHWTPATRKYYNKDWAVGFYHEGEVGFINLDTILWKVALENINNENRTATFHGSVSPTMDDVVITYRDDIDNKYEGFEIHIKEQCSSWCDKLISMDFLLVLNTSPDAHKITGRNYEVSFDFVDSSPKKTYSIIWTHASNEENISEWLENPDYFFAKSKQNINHWLSKFPPPSYIQNNSRWMKSYYRLLHDLWLSSIKRPSWDTTSNFDAYIVLPPSPVRYYGAWTSDSARMILGLTQASDDPDILNLSKQQINLFVENMYDGHFRSDIRDSYLGTGLQSPLLQIAAWQVYFLDRDKQWLETIYDGMVQDLQYRYNNRRDSNGLYYCGGLECGDGRSDSVAIDLNAEMYLSWKALANMASELGKFKDYETFMQRAEFLDGKIHYFWDESQSFFIDLQKDALNQAKDTYDKGTGFAWGFMWANHPEAINNSVYAQGMATAITDKDRFNTEILVPDIPKNDKNFHPGTCGLWWCGNSWSNLAWRAVLGLKHSGRNKESAWLREKTLNDISFYPFGWENYNSITEGKTPSGSSSLYGWTAANFIYLANSDAFDIQKLDASFSISFINPANKTSIYTKTVEIQYEGSGASNFRVYGDAQLLYDGIGTSYTWSGFSPGRHTIKVVATKGQEETSAEAVFTYEPADIDIVHPTLLFRKADLPKIRDTLLNGPYKFKYDSLIAFADGTGYWDSSWTLDQVIWTKAFYAMQLGLAYQLTNKSVYADKGKSYLLNFAKFTPEEYGQESMHAVLDTFWQLSLAYDFLYETLSREEKESVVSFFYDSCITNPSIPIEYYQEYGSHNGAGLTQGRGLCSLAIYAEHPVDPYLNLTKDYMGIFYQAATSYLGGYFGSAYSLDGITYQDYGLRHTLSYLAAYDLNFKGSLFNTYRDSLCSMPAYYTFSIWDTDSPFEYNYARRMDIGDISNAYYQPEPEILSFLAAHCRDAAAQWNLFMVHNTSDEYDQYNTHQSAEDLIWFDKSIAPLHPSEFYNLSWKDPHNGLAIWRNGWSLADDLVLTFKSDDENGGHPHADDNSLLLFYQEELLTDNGYRSGTGEIPAGESFHNTLVVDEKGSMSWSDRGSYKPTTSKQLFGQPQPIQPGDCNWPDECFYAPRDFRGRFLHYTVESGYRAVEGIKPYHELKEFTRYVVLLNTSPAIILLRDRILSDVQHDYDINFVIPYDNITSSSNELFIENNQANLLIKTIYASMPTRHRLKYKKYTKSYRGQHSYEFITSNAVRADDAYNFTSINALIPYLDDEDQPWRFTVTNEGDALVVSITGREPIQVRFREDEEVQVTFLNRSKEPRLTIWDSIRAYINDAFFFFANFSKGGEPLAAACTLKLDGISYPMIFNGQVHTYNKRFTRAGNYTYRVACNNISSQARITIIDPKPKMATFDGATTNFSNPNAVRNLTLERSAYGKVQFFGTFNLTGADLDSHVQIGRDSVRVDSFAVLNTSSRITFYHNPYVKPIILRDKAPCNDCKIIRMEGESITFMVPHFTNYSLSPGTSLTVWEESAFTNFYEQVPIWIYVNYSNSSGENIEGNCSMSIGETVFRLVRSNVSYAAKATLAEGTYPLRIGCNASGYDAASFQDQIVVLAQTCGNGDCEITDGICQEDCSLQTHCGTYNQSCAPDTACSSGSCVAIETGSANKEGGSSGGNSGSGGSIPVGVIKKEEKKPDDQLQDSLPKQENVTNQTQTPQESPISSAYKGEIPLSRKKIQSENPERLEKKSSHNITLSLFFLLASLLLFGLILKMRQKPKKHKLSELLELVREKKAVTMQELFIALQIDRDSFINMLHFLKEKEMIHIKGEMIYLGKKYRGKGIS